MRWKATSSPKQNGWDAFGGEFKPRGIGQGSIEAVTLKIRFLAPSGSE
jgi:hypothetical protein